MNSLLLKRFESIISDLDAAEQKSILEQQRQNERHPFRAICKTKYIEIRNGKMLFFNHQNILLGLSRNISCGGMSILTRKLFSKGDILESKIILNKRKPTYFLGTTVYSRFCGDSIYETGLQFIDISDRPMLVGNQHTIELMLKNIFKSTHDDLIDQSIIQNNEACLELERSSN